MMFLFRRPPVDPNAQDTHDELLPEEETEETEKETDPRADLLPGETITAEEEDDGETVTLEDGRVFSHRFVEEIRSYQAGDLKVILEEQKDLYSEEEYAYIDEVFRERLGDL